MRTGGTVYSVSAAFKFYVTLAIIPKKLHVGSCEDPSDTRDKTAHFVLQYNTDTLSSLLYNTLCSQIRNIPWKRWKRITEDSL